jgi:uncharacterized protein (TIGR02246 family)
MRGMDLIAREAAMLRKIFETIVVVSVLLATTAVRAATGDDVRAVYERFYTAQNARDLDRVREVLWEDPSFLWVSDGQSFWGREVMLARMAAFQEYDVWHVVPALDRARVVEIGPGAAYLHLPLALTFGQKSPGPSIYRFLVSMLCLKTDSGWKIAALFTTTEKEVK